MYHGGHIAIPLELGTESIGALNNWTEAHIGHVGTIISHLDMSRGGHLKMNYGKYYFEFKKNDTINW